MLKATDRSARQLESDIRAFIDIYNANPDSNT
jgi:hypothetical protein